jgi:aminoglycoside phosphotransferase (APT) family kinase protein
LANAEELTHELGLGGDVVPITGGWSSWTFEVGGQWILRVARNPEVAMAHRRELGLLPELAAAVPFEVPLPRLSGEWKGFPYMAYRRLPGRALRPTDQVDGVVPMLRALHAFPVERAAVLLGRSSRPDEAGAMVDMIAAWRAEKLRFRAEVERKVLPLADQDVGRLLAAEFDTFLDNAEDLVPCLVHNDLGVGHILVDPTTTRPSGILDFEDATIGDPAVDFVGLLIALGASKTRQLVADYGNPISWRRLLFYWRTAPAFEVLYGLQERKSEHVHAGVAGLRRRLETRDGA